MKLNSTIETKFRFKFNAFLCLIIIILFVISNVSFSQGRRDRIGTRSNYIKVKQTDSTISFVDSLYTIDSTRLAPADSSARLKYFKYSPDYNYGTKLNQIKSPVLLGNSDAIKREITFDSLNNVTITERFEGDYIKAPLIIPLDEYLNDISENSLRLTFVDIFSERFKGSNEDDLSKLFKNITDITIPLPFNSESIFGPPTFNLKLNGAVDITASYQNSSSDVTNTFGTTNSNSAINFRQEVQLTAKGTVGDKLNVDADYNTQRLFDFENQLKIEYNGYADEVIKRIQGGNVTLETRSGLIGSSQALFGVKGDFQLGALSLSAVVSQKKSKTEVKDFSRGVQETAYDIKVWDYSDNHYFIDTLYKISFLNFYNSVVINDTTDLLAVDDRTFEVWVQTDLSTVGYRQAGLHVDLGAIPAEGYNDTLKTVPTIEQGIRTYGIVRRLTASEYSFNKYAGYVSLKINIPENYFVGVAYRRIRDGVQYGTISTDTNTRPNDTLVLKMVKVPNLVPTNTLAWALKLKNIYRLPVSRVVQDGFVFEAKYSVNNTPEPTIPGTDKPLIQVLGLDKYTSGRSGPPNNLFDYIVGTTIDPEGGFIIFPDLEPFLKNIKAATPDSSKYYSQIYTELKSNSKLLPNANLYSFVGKARGEAGISNNLNLGFNVVEGSVVVKLGQIELVPNIDYSVDYTTGTVLIKNASALISKDLKVSYETNDLFTLASKTFLGLRGDYRISDKSSVGFTFVNLNQSTLNDKVRLGEEPTNNSMFGLDFTTEIPANFLTNVVNFLPGYNTKVPSSISLRGEIASIDRNPNTLKSKIPGDNNEAIAYIDDFEGAKKIVSMGGSYNSWTIASIPLDNSIINCDTCVSLYSKSKRRGKLKWFDITNSEPVTNIYPLKSFQATQANVTPLNIVYTPARRGTYNYNGSYESIPDKSTTWNGIMKYLNTSSNDLLNENINFIEFSMQIFKGDSAGVGKLVIDLGNVSQDVIPNDIVDTEDTLRSGNLQSINDDLGMDFLNDEGEKNLWRALNPGIDPPDDPALDNFKSTTNDPDYDAINGTQGNANSDAGRKPDTEDLNKTNNVRNGNDYFQYEVNLDIVDNPYVVGVGKEGWRQYKIPLSEFKKKYGSAVFTNIQFVRLWVTGVNDSVSLKLYEINLTGNQWVKQIKTDSTYNISTVSIEENAQIYKSPVPGNVLRQTVRGQNNSNTLSNEQSLAIEVTNLTNGVRKIARKDFSAAPLDLFNYRTMKFYVNGDPSFNYTNEHIYDAAMTIRFGNDSNNYYEYKTPIHPEARLGNPDAPWSDKSIITINFNALTAIKFLRPDSTNVVQAIDSGGAPGSEFKVYGNPDLKTIREIILGVEKNRNSVNSSISGSVWFDELRVINVIDNNGQAFNVSANFQMADLLSFNFGLSKVDEFFHSIDSRVGSRNTGLSWDFSTTLNLHKFLNNAFSSVLNEDWGNFINLPLTFRHSETMVNPQYYPGTDIELNAAAEQQYLKVLKLTNSIDEATKAKNNILTEAQTLVVRNSISVTNMNFNFPSNNYLVTNIFNKINFQFNAEFGSLRDITYESKSDFRYNGGITFGTDFGLTKSLNLNIGELIPLGEKFKGAKMYFFFPFIPLAPLFATNFNAGTDFNRSQADSKQRKFLLNDLSSRDFRANRGFGFNWKFLENWVFDLNGTYDFRVGSDLTPLTTLNDSLRTERPNGDIFGDIFFNNGLINFGEDQTYVQTMTFNPKINIPVLDRFLLINSSYNVRYGWLNPNQLINIGFSTGFSNTFTSTGVFKLKEIFSLFGGSAENKLRANGISGDSTESNQGNKQTLSDFLNVFKTFVPSDINVSYSQNNIVSNGGVSGLPGFGNFWFYPTTKPELGPSRLYQLGLSLYPGSRIPNLNQIADNFGVINELSFQTNINPILPEFVSMALNFKTAWGLTNNLIYSSNAVGNIGNPTSKTSSIYSGNTIFFAGNVENLNFEYNPNNVAQSRVNLTESFKSKIGSFPFPNWTLTISGLERFPFFSQFANSVTFDNSFIAEYKESKLIDINSYDIPNSQSVVQAFSPLIGLNFNFKEAFGGNLTSSFRINTSTTSTLNPIGANIQTVSSNEWSINANFSKSGFNLPLFGLSLQNDISFALTISKTTNNPTNYEFATGTGVPVNGNGSTVLNINPSVQYSLSSKVSMQLFYKYAKTEPLNSSLTTTPRTLNEGGLNIRITIQ